MPYFTSDGTNLYVDVSGSGAPMLFLHELSLDHRQWLPQREAFRATNQVFLLDWRGHGKSASSPTGHGWGRLAADAHRAAIQAGMSRQQPGVVIAHGYACDAALQLCLSEPRAMHAAVLVSPVVWGCELGVEWNALVESMRARASNSDVSGAVQLLRADTAFSALGREPDLERGVRAMQERFTGDWLRDEQEETGTPTATRLPDCKTPILVVCGADDRDDFRRTAHFVAAAVPRAKVVDLKGVAHLASLEDPEALNTTLRQFLDDSSGSKRTDSAE